MNARILIIDDEPNILESFSSLLKDEGYQTHTASTAEQGLKEIQNHQWDLVLLDLQLPGMSGLELLKELRGSGSFSQVLVISGQADIQAALEAVRLGAVDFLEKPVLPEKLIASVRASLLIANANRQRSLIIDDLEEQAKIIGRSKSIKSLLGNIKQVGPTDSNVLILGENGTGKELAATGVYLQSHRREQPFVRVNCPGIPETLFESELFGHRKGAFTGAIKDYPGKFALADGGTIFLDEIGDLPLASQAKLLRVLETGEIETLGSTEPGQVDVRVICATNRNLKELVEKKKFREDLYYRISVFVLEVPPLSARIDDIPLLVGEFLRRFDPGGNTTISPQAMAALSAQSYPGNVRQLKNCIERLTILHQNRQILPEDINANPLGDSKEEQTNPDNLALSSRLRLFESSVIAGALKACGGNISETARSLQIDRAQLSRKIKEFGLK